MPPAVGLALLALLRAEGGERGDAKLFGAAWLPAEEAGAATEAGRVHRHRRRDPGGGRGSGGAAQAVPDPRAGIDAGVTRGAGVTGACQRRLKIRPKGGAKDCHLGWWAELGVRLGFGDAVRGFFGGSGQRSHAELERSAPAGRPQGGMVYRVGVGLATRASGARCRPGPGDGVPQFSYRHCFCGRGSG